MKELRIGEFEELILLTVGIPVQQRARSGSTGACMSYKKSFIRENTLNAVQANLIRNINFIIPYGR
jgi:hypothetical protein